MKAHKNPKPCSENSALIESVVHEIQNDLQFLKLEMDFLFREIGQTHKIERLTQPIYRISKLLNDLPDYFALPEPKLSEERPERILEEIVERINQESPPKRAALRLVQKNPLPMVRVDCGQFRKALERVMEFGQALADDGGDLQIEAGLISIDGQSHVELKITSCSADSLAFEEKDAFQPFLRIKNHEVGVGMALAQEILRRHQGVIFFRKESSRQGQIRILIKVSDHEELASNRTNNR